METVHLAENLHTQNNQQFIETLNSLVPITDPFIIKIFEEEFYKRDFDFNNLILNPKEIRLLQPVRLVNNTLFETQIPLPNLVSAFYPKVKKLSDFLHNNSVQLKKRLVTYDYVLDQLFISPDEVELVNPSNDLMANDTSVFIVLKQQDKYFPDLKSLPFDLYFVVEKSLVYRGLQKISLYHKTFELMFLDLTQ